MSDGGDDFVRVGGHFQGPGAPRLGSRENLSCAIALGHRLDENIKNMQKDPVRLRSKSFARTRKNPEPK
jgi:hypothetical protein